MHHQTFSKLVNSPEKIRFEEAIEIASLIEIDGMRIINLIYTQIDPDKKK
jgi:hypothetical protein